MNVIGINGFGQNASACLLRDGKLEAFVENERFTRFKGKDPSFPVESVKYCLRSCRLSPSDVHFVAYGWDTAKYPWGMMAHLVRSKMVTSPFSKPLNSSFHRMDGIKISSIAMDALATIFRFLPEKVRSDILLGLRASGFIGRLPEIIFVPHHLSHAYSAYYCSGFDRACILTMDGSGEEICTQIALGNNEKIKVIEQYSIPDSLGWFYAAITEYLGFIPDEHEGKLMGLAAYGESRRDKNPWIEPFQDLIKLTTHGYKVNPYYIKYGSHTFGKKYTDAFVRFITSHNSKAVPLYLGDRVEVNGQIIHAYFQEHYIDIAWATQHLLETTAIHLANTMMSKLDVDKVCLAGGVALNCKMNGEILSKSNCKEIFVQPAASDAGAALGAAMYVAQQGGDCISQQLTHTYYGPEYTNCEIEHVLKRSNLKYHATDNPSREAAELMAKGEPIAWFQGRMEFGPRALGNRSILANPLKQGIRDFINSEVKSRELWRPLCPSMLNEVKEKYLCNPKSSPFMIIAHRINNKYIEDLNEIVHVDGTIRPQTVTEQDNPMYYELIKRFGEITGHSVVLNTSYNGKGEPVVCSPDDAIKSFSVMALKTAFIGNYRVSK